jgi:putative addiction module killer protein
MKEIRIYRTREGKEPFVEWNKSLKDKVARAQVGSGLDRLVNGNYGDCEPVGEGVYELRIHYGPGYRVYFVEQEKTLILLLIGGSKKTQKKDIKKAKDYWMEFRERCYD